MKAAVGDFEGDGRDDIAVLRVMLEYWQVKWRFNDLLFGAYVDWYTFDQGSIKPKYNVGSSSRKGS